MKTHKRSRPLTLLLCLAALEAMTVHGQDLDPIPVGQHSPQIEWGQVGEMRGNLMYMVHLQDGLTVVDIGNPLSPQFVGGLDTDQYVRGSDVALSGDHVFLATEFDGLLVIDITDPAKPTEVGRYATISGAQRAEVSGHYAYVLVDTAMQVLDIAEPATPEFVGSFDNDRSLMGLAVKGQYAYLAADRIPGNPDLPGHLLVVDVADPSNPLLVATIGDFPITEDLVVVGDFAYVLGGGLSVFDLSNPTSPVQIGAVVDLPGTGPMPLGYPSRLTVVDNHVYVSEELITHIINVRDPTSPIRVGEVQGRLGIPQPNGYASPVFGSAILDTLHPANPQRVGKYEVVEAGGPAWVMDMAVSGDLAFLVVSEDNGGGLEIVDISSPEEPRAVGRYTTTRGNPRSVKISGEHVLLLSGGGDEPSDWEIIDVSDPSLPQQVALMQTDGYPLAASGKYAFTTRWFYENGQPGFSFEVIDISDMENPHRVGQCPFLGSPGAPDLGGLTVAGNHVYVTASWTEEEQELTGFHIMDVTAPSAPRLVGSYQRRPNPGFGRTEPMNITVSDGYALVTYWQWDFKHWLEVVDVRDPANPVGVGLYPREGSVFSAMGRGVEVAVSGDYAYLTSQPFGLHVLDISDPHNPRRVGGNTAFAAQDIAIQGGHVFVTDPLKGLMVLDQFTPIRMSPSILSGGTGMLLRISGPEGRNLRIQRSDNLEDWSDWVVVPTGEQPIEVGDPESATVEQRFYRALER